jgi:hypothetical protein
MVILADFCCFSLCFFAQVVDETLIRDNADNADRVLSPISACCLKFFYFLESVFVAPFLLTSADFVIVFIFRKNICGKCSGGKFKSNHFKTATGAFVRPGIRIVFRLQYNDHYIKNRRCPKSHRVQTLECLSAGEFFSVKRRGAKRRNLLI